MMATSGNFGVKLKTTTVMEGSCATGRGVATTRTSSSVSRSIRTPLKPANVKDLKAMFDQSKDGKDAKTKTETKTVRTVSSTSSSSISPRSREKEDSGIKVVSLISTRSNMTQVHGGSTGNISASKESSSTADLLAKYRANRSGLYREPPITSESLGGTVSQSSPDLTRAGNKSPLSPKTTVFSVSANERPKEASVPRLNLSRVTSTESVNSASSKDDSPRSRGDCASPVSTGSGSPKLIGRAKPKYLPSPRADTADSTIRVEIPVSHHSSKDETKLSIGGSSFSRFGDSSDRLGTKTTGLSRFGDSSDSSSKSKGLSRFTDSSDKSCLSKTTRFGDSDKTVLSKYSTEVKGPVGSRTKTVEISHLESKSGSPIKVSVDTPIPWSDKSRGKASSILNSKDDGKVKTDFSTLGAQPSWLEKKNARNVLSNFVSSAQTKSETKTQTKSETKTQTKSEHEIPVQRISGTNRKSSQKEAWTPLQKTTIVSKVVDSKVECTSVDVKPAETRPNRKARGIELKSTKTEAIKVKKSDDLKSSNTPSAIKPQITKRTSGEIASKSEVSKSNSAETTSSIVQARKTMLTSTSSATKTTARPPPRKMSGEKLEVSTAPGADIRKMVSRKMSTERFQRLKFDFERGVPTESFERRGSEIDHLELKKRVSEIPTKPTTTKITKSDSFKRKEESIFASGLKVSDFVAQVNNLETNKQPGNAGRKWKAGVSRLKRSSRVLEDGQENEYLEVGDNDGDISGSDSEAGIYEFVPEAGLGDDGEGNFENNVDVAGKGRRYGVYSKKDFLKAIADKMAKLKQKGLKKPSFKTKSKSNSLGRSKKLPSSVPSIPDLTSEHEKIAHSEEEEDWETDSNSTTYEPIPGESLYEEAGFGTDEKDSKKFSQSLGDKIKAKVNISAQATSVLNKIGNKFGKIGKTKGSEPPSISTGTDSEMETMDEALGDELEKVSSLSRSSSERSSGKRQKKELSETVSSKLSEDEGLSCPTPPPLPPRSSRVLNQTNIENSPPLPPRNPSTSGPGLDMVIPAPERAPSSHSTGDLRRKGQLSISKDSYLHGQHLKSASLGDVPASMDTTDQASEEFPDGYVDYDPSSRKTESVDRRDFSKTSVKKKKASFFRKTSTMEEKERSSTSSSGYIHPDSEQWPAPVESGSLYHDLDDDQVYGRLGKEFKLKPSKFVNEPLYQYYTKESVIRASRKIHTDEALSDDDSGKRKKKKKKEGGIYEDVEQMLHDGILTEEEVTAVQDDISPSKRSTMLEVLGRTGSLHRALWCEMPEVKDKGVLDSMDPQERKLQEAMFEIVTSEASYLKSLNILITVFLVAPEFSADLSDRCVVTKRERQVLFSNIGAIRDASERFLADLEERWQSNCVMHDICDIIYSHAQKNFEPYVRYTSNQRFQENMLETLKKRSEYIEAVRRLERNPECQSLPMSSFLLLPMQRITRLPLLVDAICHRLEPGSDRHKSAAKALEHLNRVVRKCNDGAKKMQQTEQMCLLASQLDFKIKEFPLISASRYIVKQGELTRIVTEAGSRIPFGKAFRGPSKQNTYLFLFNDMMMVTKKKGTTFSVIDYCARNSLHVEAIDSVEKCRLLPQGVPSGCKNLFLLVFLENFEKKQVEMVLSCASPSDRTRWIDAVTPVTTSETERIYQDWDCPQVQCVKKYVAKEPDELSLEESDVVNVYKKTDDNWYEGERIRDGERGWFPSNHTEEIMNSHVRARNLRLRYRLLIASQEFTETGGK